ncbi:RNA 3'-terminal phosphate cyclase [Desulfonema magnum]|uniref:RNA 3'-terminal phosphate cyclase n=1 Tax=Desulfonema magnum TaxID=45655 RepID=A0A975GRM2_9BACT|nr:RNA 3'-terminal phosphate cyclase [Desulfonema magnum]QTA91062.1 RNA 3'-terminal phosphate cyclase [Desulfonema magnum]
MIKIDGSFLEGGGQIIRTSLALSALTGKAFTISGIRKGRSKPGLRPQHLNAVRAVRQLCNAEVSGDAPDSQALVFTPKKTESANLSVDIGTAGSVTLLMQSLLIPAVFGGKNIVISLKGGTDVRWSQPYDYFRNILLKYIEPFAGVESELIRRGYYPKGGGEIKVTLKPKFSLTSYENFSEHLNEVRSQLPEMNLCCQGELKAIEGVSHASEKLKGVPERQARQARKVLEKLQCPVSIKTEYSQSRCPGSGITLRAVFSEASWPVLLGGDSLGERGKRAEKVGEEAALRLMKQIESGAAVDKYLADQLLPLAVFLPSARYKASEITPHCRTNIYVIEKFLPVTFSADDNIVNLRRVPEKNIPAFSVRSSAFRRCHTA